MTATIIEVEHQGIPVLLAPSDGPVQGGLVFRVGKVDESIPLRGISHLVEHLALHGVGNDGCEMNGASGNGFTQFFASGTEAEVVTFLNAVCASLVQLPLDRIDHEKRILRTESPRAQSEVAERQVRTRFGATPLGMSSFPEFGIAALSAATVAEWAASRFTSSNVVAWITTSELPAGLNLGLPSGSRYPLPALTQTVPVLPGFHHSPDNSIVVDAVVPPTPANEVFAELAGEALFRELRGKHALSYSTGATVLPIDAEPEVEMVVVWADSAENEGPAAVGALLDTIAAIGAGRFTDQDLKRAQRAAAARTADAPAAARLMERARRILTGSVRHDSDRDRDAAIEATTSEDVASVARSLMKGGLLQVPAGTDASGFGFDWLGGIEVVKPVLGHRFSGPDRDYSVVLSAEGVSTVGRSYHRTVLFADCVALLKFPDGGRILIGPSGLEVQVEPGFLDGFFRASWERIDAGVPATAHLDMPRREPDRIPRASRTSPPRRGLGVWAAVVCWILSVPLALFALVAVGELLALGGTSPLTGEPGSASAALGLAILSVPLLALFVPLAIGRRRRRRWEKQLVQFARSQ